MAGSRLEKFGTVFTRVRDLIRAGVVKEKDKPIWYDVYAAFPPKRPPLYVKPQTRVFVKTEDNVPEIFYKEDAIRAKFYETYGNGPKMIDLSRSTFVSSCQRFVEKYNELQSTGGFEEDALFEETSKALLAEGILLRRKGVPAVAPEPRDPVLGMKLTEMLAEEQQANTAAPDTTAAAAVENTASVDNTTSTTATPEQTQTETLATDANKPS
ncbi:28S ribosomal protein S23, mitochondrial [Engraulis encrasicolus]|uniref:28S ribosomal protein S23, mitochondrial n=1 Tax=Engraulis encrasicolus TaxID=184585 RepID=UPI002FD35C44